MLYSTKKGRTGEIQMNKQEFAVERRIDLLKTIRDENPELKSYMSSLISEMKNPESFFNTGKTNDPFGLDKRTGMRLSDAFEVAKEYSEKYQLDFTELVSFVSVKTVELIHDKSQNFDFTFKKYIASAIRTEYPICNPLLARSEYQNSKHYSIYDEGFDSGKVIPNQKMLEDKSILFVPIRKLERWDYSSKTIENQLDERILIENIDAALKMLEPTGEKALRIRFGFNDGQRYTLEEIGKIFGKSASWVCYTEHHALRVLHSRRCCGLLNKGIIYDYPITPIGRGINRNIEHKSASLMTWPLQYKHRHTVRCQYNVRCICGGKVAFKCINNQKTLTCQKCGKVYPIKTKTPSNQ